MDKDTTATWLEINDETYDGQTLAETIEARLRSRPPIEGEEERLAKIPPYGSTGSLPELPADMPYLFDLLHHLRTAARTHHRIDLRPVLVPSPATRLPLIGPLWNRIRHFAHQLVLFYVNKHADQQIQINYQLVQSIVELTKRNIHLQREVDALREKYLAQEERQA